MLGIDRIIQKETQTLA